MKALSRLALLMAILTCGLAARAQDVVPAPPTPAETDPEPADPQEADPDPVPDSADPDQDQDPDLAADPDPDQDQDLDPAADPDPDPAADPAEDDPLPEEHRPALDISVDPIDGLMTGDVFTLRITADAVTGDDLAIPRDQDFAPFEILDRRVRTEARGGRTVHVFELDLLALEPGAHELPPVRIRVVTREQVVGEVTTTPRPVTIGSVLGNEPNAEPRPPTQPVTVMQEDDTLWWILGALGIVLVTALLTLLFARWYRRRREAAKPPPPPRPAWEIAIEKLEALRQDRPAAVEEERVDQWVDGVSDALREYLGHRYGFDGLESTTDEVIAELRKSKVVGVSQDEIVAILHDCDLVKFAQAHFDAEQCDELLAGGFRVVRATTPKAVPMPSAPAASSGPTGSGGPPAPILQPKAPEPDHPDARWMGATEPAAAPAPTAPEAASAPAAPEPEPAPAPVAADPHDRWKPKDPPEAAPPAPSTEPTEPPEPAESAEPATASAESALADAGTPLAPMPPPGELPASPFAERPIPGTVPPRGETEERAIPDTLPGARLIPQTLPPADPQAGKDTLVDPEEPDPEARS